MAGSKRKKRKKKVLHDWGQQKDINTTGLPGLTIVPALSPRGVSVQPRDKRTNNFTQRTG